MDKMKVPFCARMMIIKVPFRAKIVRINFLIRRKRKICPVEVKSGLYRKHSSLDKFRNRFKGKTGQPYILYMKDILIKEDVVHLPIYMTMFL